MAAAVAVLEFELTCYRRTWRASALSNFVLPTLFMVGFGVGLGRFVDAGSELGGVPYLNYVMPGLLASTAMQLAFGESTWPVLSRFEWIRSYHAMVATPLRVVDIVSGALMYVLFRVLTTTTAFLMVAVGFGVTHSWWAVAVLPVCGLLGIAVAAPVMAFVAWTKRDGYFTILTRFVLIPMTLFAGVFFPISRLPDIVRWLAYGSPLWHAAVLCRAVTLPGFGLQWWSALGHVAYLMAWAVAGIGLAVPAFRRRLAI
jgi:lipooligosaccharide transport system permease protein